MPIYLYNCPNCGANEYRHPHDVQMDTCPICKAPVQKQITPVGIIFKGKGFYSTDKNAQTSSMKE